MIESQLIAFFAEARQRVKSQMRETTTTTAGRDLSASIKQGNPYSTMQPVHKRVFEPVLVAYKCHLYC